MCDSAQQKELERETHRMADTDRSTAPRSCSERQKTQHAILQSRSEMSRHHHHRADRFLSLCSSVSFIAECRARSYPIYKMPSFLSHTSWPPYHRFPSRVSSQPQSVIGCDNNNGDDSKKRTLKSALAPFVCEIRLRKRSQATSALEGHLRCNPARERGSGGGLNGAICCAVRFAL